MPSTLVDYHGRDDFSCSRDSPNNCYPVTCPILSQPGNLPAFPADDFAGIALSHRKALLIHIVGVFRENIALMHNLPKLGEGS